MRSWDGVGDCRVKKKKQKRRWKLSKVPLVRRGSEKGERGGSDMFWNKITDAFPRWNSEIGGDDMQRNVICKVKHSIKPPVTSMMDVFM